MLTEEDSGSCRGRRDMEVVLHKNRWRSTLDGALRTSCPQYADRVKVLVQEVAERTQVVVRGRWKVQARHVVNQRRSLIANKRHRV